MDEFIMPLAEMDNSFRMNVAEAITTEKWGQVFLKSFQL